MGKYETLELEINVPTETVRMPGVVTPWLNDSLIFQSKKLS